MPSNPVNYIALLPLRGGSQGIPRKNILPFMEKPLFTWSANAAISAGIPLVISTDDSEIKSYIKKYTPTARVLERPKELATNTASTESVISHFLDNTECDHIILLQATSPMTLSSHLTDAVKLYLKEGCKPLVSGTRQHTFHWSEDGTPINYDPRSRPRRQDWKGTFIENGAFYIFSRKDFEANLSRCAPPCTLYEMESLHSIEIDTQFDWLLLEMVAKARQGKT
jgi:N-acylneuraminate cytidylyltransferase